METSTFLASGDTFSIYNARLMKWDDLYRTLALIPKLVEEKCFSFIIYSFECRKFEVVLQMDRFQRFIPTNT